MGLEHFLECQAGDVSKPLFTRQAPPDFRLAQVVAATALSSRMVSMTLAGPELVGLEVEEPGASVRLLLPGPDSRRPLEIPTWHGNEFLNADGTRPPIRTLTPLRVNAQLGQLDVEIVTHGHGALSRWAAGLPVNAQVGVSGPGRGYAVPPNASNFLLVGDEAALPAIGQVVSAIPHSARIQAVIETARLGLRYELPSHPGLEQRWVQLGVDDVAGSAMNEAVASLEIPENLYVWAAGEAAAVQALRRLLLGDRGVPRSHAVIRGYWKLGRDGVGTTGVPTASGVDRDGD